MSKRQTKRKPIATVTDGGPEEAAELLKAIEAAERDRLAAWKVVEAKRLALKEAKERYETAAAAVFKACQSRMEPLPLFGGEAEEDGEGE